GGCQRSPQTTQWRYCATCEPGVGPPRHAAEETVIRSSTVQPSKTRGTSFIPIAAPGLLLAALVLFDNRGHHLARRPQCVRHDLAHVGVLHEPHCVPAALWPTAPQAVGKTHLLLPPTFQTLHHAITHYGPVPSLSRRL